jgi:hypothetical protein
MSSPGAMINKCLPHLPFQVSNHYFTSFPPLGGKEDHKPMGNIVEITWPVVKRGMVARLVRFVKLIAEKGFRPRLPGWQF